MSVNILFVDPMPEPPLKKQGAYGPQWVPGMIPNGVNFSIRPKNFEGPRSNSGVEIPKSRGKAKLTKDTSIE